jgi:hypothetical protein
MPTYDCRCVCGWTGEVFAGMRAEPACPSCGANANKVPSIPRIRTSYDHTRAKSMMYGYRQHEVQRARAAIAKHDARAAQAIQDDGSVVYEDRAHAKRFERAHDQHAIDAEQRHADSPEGKAARANYDAVLTDLIRSC